MIERVRDVVKERLPQFFGLRVPCKGQLNRTRRRCRYRQGHCARAIDAADQQCRRPANRRQRNLAKCGAPLQCCERNIDLPEQIACGEFAPLLAWLQHHIYHHGRKFEPDQLVERVTGSPLRTDAYVRYLQTKFGEIYKL